MPVASSPRFSSRTHFFTIVVAPRASSIHKFEGNPAKGNMCDGVRLARLLVSRTRRLGLWSSMSYEHTPRSLDYCWEICAVMSVLKATSFERCARNSNVRFHRRIKVVFRNQNVISFRITGFLDKKFRISAPHFIVRYLLIDFPIPIHFFWCVAFVRKRQMQSDFCPWLDRYPFGPRGPPILNPVSPNCSWLVHGNDRPLKGILPERLPVSN